MDERGGLTFRNPENFSRSFLHVLYSSELVWPEHAERKSNSRDMFLSTQTLSLLTPGSSPMDLTEEQTAHTEESGEELILNVFSVSMLKHN